MRKRLTTSPSPEDENPYFLSFSDMMSGLLAIFILASIALIIELTQIKNQLNQEITEVERIKKDWEKEMYMLTAAEKVRSEMLGEISKELNEKGILVHLSTNSTVLRIPEEVIHFKTAEFTLPDDSEKQRNIALIGDTIYRHLIKNDRWRFIDTVFVEGHTDAAVYRNSKIKGNWGLSTFRAISLWEFWAKNESDASKLQSLRNAENHLMFSVSGYADTRPTACISDDLKEEIGSCPDATYYQSIEKEIAYSKNRRIDIRFTVRKPNTKDYKETQR